MARLTKKEKIALALLLDLASVIKPVFDHITPQTIEELKIKLFGKEESNEKEEFKDHP